MVFFIFAKPGASIIWFCRISYWQPLLVARIPWGNLWESLFKQINRREKKTPQVPKDWWFLADPQVSKTTAGSLVWLVGHWYHWGSADRCSNKRIKPNGSSRCGYSLVWFLLNKNVTQSSSYNRIFGGGLLEGFSQRCLKSLHIYLIRFYTCNLLIVRNFSRSRPW